MNIKEWPSLNYSESCLQGAEVPAVVLFANYIDGLHNIKLFSRCIAHLIIVLNEAQALAMELDKSIANVIPVFGEYFDRNMLSP